ncbi:MAG: type IV toxin-antitoxin system AbiEi family antitoxin [Candidatus Delongbacteria bacterium]|nr:type IV toxin-antitoxin system AbiEi family antitoxin [Candidatus Delongbacteria bacterium]MDD4205866.1 type IV toxin-antitoxin system AbiEi family antitoxin [Candidatus Delongbacteria bacterium]
MIKTIRLEDYVFKARSMGRYSITLKELREYFDASEKALQQSLFRLKVKKTIVQLRQGFYIIIPPEYSAKGMLPIYLFIDDMMKYLGRDYYLGLFTAASLHGASHQQPMEYQVIINSPPLRRIEKNNIQISFSVNNNFHSKDIVKKKSDAGYVNVSSPELTMLDLIFFNKNYGGITRTLAIIDELQEAVNKKNLTQTAKSYKSTPAVQRLGFLMDIYFKNENLSDALFKALNTDKITYIELCSGGKDICAKNTKWKVIQNLELEGLYDT